MAIDLTTATRDAILASGKALASGEVAARLRQPRAAVEAALEALRNDPQVAVCEWPMTDPHFGAERIVVVAPVADPADPISRHAADTACQHVYDNVVRDFLASHRCV